MDPDLALAEEFVFDLAHAWETDRRMHRHPPTHPRRGAPRPLVRSVPTMGESSWVGI